MNPSIKILSKTDLKLELEISGVDISYVNGLRRAIYADVPTLAIDIVKFLDNSTTLTEEFIAHRLGLIPLRTAGSLSAISYWYTCDEEHSTEIECRECTFKGTLNISNDSTKIRVVTDKDIKFDHGGISTLSNYLESSFGAAETPSIPILKLAPGESINALLYARKDRGKIHAKWCPAACVVLRPLARIILCDEFERLPQQHNDVARTYISETCPRNVFTIENRRVVVKDSNSCIFCNDCFNIPISLGEQGDNANTIWHPALVTQQPNAFYFSIESNGSISAYDIFLMACDEISARADEILAAATSVFQVSAKADNVIMSIEDDSLT
ncbi:DNA-directed RNA polymerase RPB3 [Giardia duodenalis]|uniref:DNA-directed RNA polymerase RPB3 n=2 Tax=Giardia intestinalis TaxID=5741 RepID=E2RTY7_GIAIC|nr:DNA-directed RNA polymerase RPB3 [Giardia intestinalis]AAM77734.1 RNA polymerase II subunit Rpb3 [Giardia intestinalis]ESU36201.1 RNA polymerase Rpb3/RpoA insert domain [Giardia intestinalis]KAE8305304.1 DNA-directed RNA polymerase RPB3 [Giardia intestinalis]|eukprot:XP_001707984.1 DNA-directed RNA polymerase RPB3 [Giardia lamblia ATCC 50803]